MYCKANIVLWEYEWWGYWEGGGGGGGEEEVEGSGRRGQWWKGAPRERRGNEM